MASGTVRQGKGYDTVASAAELSLLYLLHCNLVCACLHDEYLGMTIIARKPLRMGVMRIYDVRQITLYPENYIQVYDRRCRFLGVQ